MRMWLPLVLLLTLSSCAALTPPPNVSVHQQVTFYKAEITDALDAVRNTAVVLQRHGKITFAQRQDVVRYHQWAIRTIHDAGDTTTDWVTTIMDRLTALMAGDPALSAALLPQVQMARQVIMKQPHPLQPGVTP